MYTVKRRIKIKDKNMDVWFGLVSKRKGRYYVYLFTDNPDNPHNHAELILSDMPDKEEAVKAGIRYAKNLFKTILDNQSCREISE